MPMYLKMAGQLGAGPQSPCFCYKLKCISSTMSIFGTIYVANLKTIYNCLKQWRNQDFKKSEARLDNISQVMDLGLSFTLKTLNFQLKASVKVSTHAFVPNS